MHPAAMFTQWFLLKVAKYTALEVDLADSSGSVTFFKCHLTSTGVPLCQCQKKLSLFKINLSFSSLAVIHTAWH
jgi:hypothetical protein